MTAIQSLTPIELCRKARTMAVTDDTLTDAQQADLLAAILSLQEMERISDGTMAKILRCSLAVWSQVKRGIYTGNTAKFLIRGREWMAQRVERQAAPATPYVKTNIGERIMAACRRAWELPCIAKIVGPAGCGKTAALMEFVRRRGDRALYLQCGVAFNTKVGLIMELADRLKITQSNRMGSSGVYRAIRDRLAKYYAAGENDPFVLVVDEATTLKPNALEVLRNLHDDPACRVAVILADTARLEGELASRHGIAGGYEQLTRRFGAQYVLRADAAIDRKDVAAVADSTLDALGFSGKLDRHALDYLCEIAQEPGKLGNVVYRLHAVHGVLSQSGQEPAYGVVELDFVADLVGARRRYPDQAPAFLTEREQQRKTA